LFDDPTPNPTLCARLDAQELSEEGDLGIPDAIAPIKGLLVSEGCNQHPSRQSCKSFL